MSLVAINSTIKALCEEITLLQSNLQVKWEVLSEEELLFEIAVCMFSSQMVFEVAVAAASRIKTLNLINGTSFPQHLTQARYQTMVRDAFSEPLAVQVDGSTKDIVMRFRNRLSTMLAATVYNLYGKGLSLRSILSAAATPSQARRLLVENVIGFGPKQASLYLRRVGFCAELAVIDTHIVDYFKLATGIDIRPSSLSRISSYEKIEVEFSQIASQFGYTIGCVDLAIWITMRVAKRGYAI